MNYKLLTIILLCQINSFAQKDSVFHNHLVVKFAPMTYLGTHAALQFGVETNLTPKMTIGFDYAYGDSNIASFQRGGSYLDGETSQRFRLSLHWYKKPFMEYDRTNNFWGIELFNRTNYYPSITTIGRSCASADGFSNNCNYYERIFGTSTFQVWGFFVKYGTIFPINNKLWVELYGGLGVASRNNIVGNFNLEPNDRIYNYDDQLNGRGIGFFDYHKPYGFSRIGGDILLSAKINYRIF